MAEEELVKSLVVIGSSAGGIEALSELVSTIPEDFPAPIILAQHLHPKRESSLDRILARRSRLPIESITGRHPLKNSVIYLVVPNTNIRITDHEVTRLPDDHERPMPSIDLLFSSAAEIFGEELIGVILTGTGPDGSAGARDIKARGGTVVIQNPETAAFPSMPLSLAPTIVDIVADIGEIGPILNDLLRGVFTVEASPEDASLNGLLKELRQRSGIDFSSYKTPTITRRIQRRMAVTGQRTLASYQNYLSENTGEYSQLATSFLIKVTEFFRDPDVFHYFREGGLETLLDHARERGELRVWSAGCATGEEAYSLAILIAELLGDDLDRMSVRVFGTDLDEDAVAFARRGIYPVSAVARLPRELVDKYFARRNENELEVRESIRSLVVFGQHDLGQRSPFPRIDLTFCRNVLIYFTTELQQRSLQLFAFALRDGGLLVLGKAESVHQLSDYFAVEEPDLKVYRRVGDHVVIPSTRIRDIALAQSQELSHEARQRRYRLHPERQTSVPAALGRTENILRALPTGVVIVDRNYRIAMINPAARRHLSIHSAALNDDFIHLAQHVPLSEVRNAIDAALRHESSEHVFAVDLPTRSSEQPRYLQFVCHPIADDRQPEIVGQVLLCTADVTENETGRRALNDAQNQLRRLTEAHRQLERANENLASVNANLHTTNEELLISSEEFQAAAEEVETLNEELQATNEELETTNEELQATIEELNTTNDDLQARSRELEDMVETREVQRQQAENQRLQLEALLLSLDEAIALIDHHGEVIRSNEAFRQTFGPAGERLTFEDADGHQFPSELSVFQRTGRGETFSSRFFVSANGTRREFMARGKADADDDGVSGGLILIREIQNGDGQ